MASCPAQARGGSEEALGRLPFTSSSALPPGSPPPGGAAPAGPAPAPLPGAAGAGDRGRHRPSGEQVQPPRRSPSSARSGVPAGNHSNNDPGQLPARLCPAQPAGAGRAPHTLCHACAWGVQKPLSPPPCHPPGGAARVLGCFNGEAPPARGSPPEAGAAAASSRIKEKTQLCPRPARSTRRRPVLSFAAANDNMTSSTTRKLFLCN